MLSKLFVLILSVLIADISCNSCDTYRHPTYGIGRCVPTTQCPNSLYISGLCENEPANVKCCFSAGSGSSSCTSPTQKLSHSTALSRVNAAGISVSSSGGCSDRNRGTCTSLEQINCRSIDEIINYRKVSGCTTIITGGTETGHSGGTYSHWNGYKIDIGLNSCHDSYIKRNFAYAGVRGDGATLYKDKRSPANTWALEGNHWDILFP